MELSFDIGGIGLVFSPAEGGIDLVSWFGQFQFLVNQEYWLNGSWIWFFWDTDGFTKGFWLFRFGFSWNTGGFYTRLFWFFRFGFSGILLVLQKVFWFFRFGFSWNTGGFSKRLDLVLTKI